MEALLQEKNLKRFCIVILMSLWAWSVLGGTTMPGDSLGLKTVQGKSFIVYQIAAGETAYAVSRKYGVPYKDIAAANPGVDMNSLKSGQEILVPTLFAATSVVEEKTPVFENSSSQSNAINNSPAVGEVKVEPAPSLENLPAQTNPEYASNESTDQTNGFALTYASYQSMDMIAVYEKGAATWIENNGIESGGDRFYALSNTAPIGSIIKVRNMMNNRIVYAKVIGRLSETEVNAKVLVKLSAGAGERLNVLDNRFVVEITYFTSEEVKNND